MKTKHSTKKPIPLNSPLSREPTSDDEDWKTHEALCPIPALLVPPDDNPRRFRVLPGLRCMAIAAKLHIHTPSLTRALYFGRMHALSIPYFNRSVNALCGTTIADEDASLVNWIATHPWSIWYRTQYYVRYCVNYKNKQKQVDSGKPVI